ncbi:MAG TPA: hypothetical protein VGQ83_26180 [Polyangia bacterium]|jgi:hypothetical protein
MRTRALWITVLGAGLAPLAGCTVGSGVLAREQRTVASFTAVTAAGSLDVSGGTLTLWSDELYTEDLPLRIAVTAPPSARSR